ncbi:MAG: hypothetical protein M0T73_08415 [Deltaproteobacteria bacterium]|nr:hypothetical protein [Deltaproteobacteria bacterium]
MAEESVKSQARVVLTDLAAIKETKIEFRIVPAIKVNCFFEIGTGESLVRQAS